MSEALYIPSGGTTWWSSIKARQVEWRGRWTKASQITRTRVQVGLLIGSVLVAYNYSLSTLIQTANEQTPLAYISLVPVIALALAAIRSRPLKPEPPIHDRQLDYTIGIPLIAAAVAINELLPARLSAMFWVYRVDLLSLPIFIAGATAIIFGCRVLWRQKLAIAFLFLAWPYPYEKYLLGILNGFTDVTLSIMQRIAVFTHLAKPLNSAGDIVFSITHNGSNFSLSVVSACSGVNGVVGFLLVGSAFAVIVRGPIVRKVLWLVGGMALLFALNIGRITFIFFAGKEWGESVALNVFHPFIGLALFTLGVVAMLALIRPLGMRIQVGQDRMPTSGSSESAATPSLTVPPNTVSSKKGPIAVPKIYLAAFIVVVATLFIGVNNVGLSAYNLVAGVAGQAKLSAFIQHPAAVQGWETRYETTYTWAKPLFGDTSTWNRYIMQSAGVNPLETHSSVVADVINTPDLSSFSAFGVENCYTFHGYALADVTQVALAGGITGQSMSYSSQQFGSWSIVYWIVPVKMAAGGTNFERTVLYVQNSGPGVVIKGLTTDASLRNLGGTLSASNRDDRALINNRTFLVAFANRLIEAQAFSKVSVQHDGVTT